MLGHENLKVLVVDDERLIADTLTMILSKTGYDAQASYSGEMALEMARNFQPDMVITDAVMPGMNGIEAAIRLREMLPACKVLLFSGHTATLGILETARTQNYEFELLFKPIHPKELLAKLRSSASSHENLHESHTSIRAS
jgi:DNA-binding response OmpR family regulator